MQDWMFIDIAKLVDEATLSGNAGGGFPKPFLAVDNDKKKHEFPVMMPPNLEVDDHTGDSEEAKLWKKYLR